MAKDLYNDKVEISVATLIEMKRAINALTEDKESYVHKVFSDDGCFRAFGEINKTYQEYFKE